MKTFREIPMNLAGQYSKNGMRYYPTLWIMADVQFIDLNIDTEYPPHISLACVAVQLDMDKVENLTKNNDNDKNDNEAKEQK